MKTLFVVLFTYPFGIALSVLIVINCATLNGATYYVNNQAANASDANAGTVSAPFMTISKCSTVAGSGDICVVSEGIYRESLSNFTGGTSANPTTIRAETGATVVVTAFDELVENQNGAGTWTDNGGNVYKIQLDASYNFDNGAAKLGRNMILIDGIKQNQARCPNTSKSSNYRRGEDFAISTAGEIGAKVNPSDPNDHNYYAVYELSGIGDFWAGGFIQFSAGYEWWGNTGAITAATNGRIDFWFNTLSDWHRQYQSPTNDDPFFLWGRLEALDYEKEFYFDAANDYGSANTLYVYGDPRGKTVEYKKRDYILNIANASHLRIEGIQFVGGRLQTDINSANVVFGWH